MSDGAAAAVRVPGSSANLGPGFDAFAAAVGLYLAVSSVPRGDRRVIADGEGWSQVPADDSNLIWRALLAYCDRFDCPVPDITLRARNAIPLERGLGSSSAAAVAGAALARASAGGGATDQDLIDLAAEFDGHPDNAAAAVLGGLVVCSGGQARRLEPTDGLQPVVCIPPTRQSTEQARGILPSTVSLADAAANTGRAAVVLGGLSGTMAWDPAAMMDVLHEPARLAAMAGSGALVAALREHGVGACLSGAGPTVLAVVNAGDTDTAAAVRRIAGHGWDVRPLSWDRSGALVQRNPET